MNVRSFCEQHQIVIPDRDAQCVARRGRSRNQQNESSVKHYYRVELLQQIIISWKN